MIRSVCCVCGIHYGTKPDGRAEVLDSHGFCQKHYYEAMANIESQFAELPADLAHWEERC
jgi:hypothetical protein